MASDIVVCKRCGVDDSELAKCDGCGEMVLHEELCHHDDDGAVYCQECDEFVTEPYDEEADEDAGEDEGDDEQA